MKTRTKPEMFVHSDLLNECLRSWPSDDKSMLEKFDQLHAAIEHADWEGALHKLDLLLDIGRFSKLQDDVCKITLLLHVPYLLNQLLAAKKPIEATRLILAYSETRGSKEEIEPCCIQFVSAPYQALYYLIIADIYYLHGDYDQAALNYKLVLKVPEKSRLQLAAQLQFKIDLTTIAIDRKLQQLEDSLVIGLEFVGPMNESMQGVLSRFKNRIDRYLHLAPTLEQYKESGQINFVTAFYQRIIPHYLAHIRAVLIRAISLDIRNNKPDNFIQAFIYIAPLSEQWLAHRDYCPEIRTALKELTSILTEHRKKMPHDFFDVSHCYYGKTSLDNLELRIDKEELTIYPDPPRSYPRLDCRHTIRETRKQNLLTARTAPDIFLETQKKSSLSVTRCLEGLIEETVSILPPAPGQLAVLATGSITRGSLCAGSDVDVTILYKLELKNNEQEQKAQLYFKQLLSLLQKRLLFLGDGSIDIDTLDIGALADDPPIIGTPQSLFKRHHPSQAILKTLPEGLTNSILIYAQLRPILLFASKPSDIEGKGGLSLFEEYVNSIRIAIQRPLIMEAEHKNSDYEAGLAQDARLGEALGLKYFHMHLGEFNKARNSKKNVHQVNFKQSYVAPLVFCCTNLALYYRLETSLAEDKPSSPSSRREFKALATYLIDLLKQLEDHLAPPFIKQLYWALQEIQILQEKSQAAYNEHYGKHKLSSVNMVYWQEKADISAETLPDLVFTSEQRNRLDCIDTLLLMPIYQYMDNCYQRARDGTGAGKQLPPQVDIPLAELASQFGKLSPQSTVVEITSAIDDLISLIYHRCSLQIYTATETREKLLEFSLQLPTPQLKEQYFVTAKKKAQQFDLPFEAEWLSRITHSADATCSARKKEVSEWEDKLSTTLSDTFSMIAIDEEPSEQEPTQDIQLYTPTVTLIWRDSSNKEITVKLPRAESSKLVNSQGELVQPESKEAQSDEPVFKIQGKQKNPIAYLKFYPLAYLKFCPQMPVNQFTVDYLSWAVGGFGAINKLALLKVEFDNTADYMTHPVLLTRPASYGLSELIRNEQADVPNTLTLTRCESDLDNESFTLFILTSLWINPEDEHWKNIGVESFLSALEKVAYRCIRFDVGSVFVNELGERQNKLISFEQDKTTNTKSAALCLESMKKPLSKTAVLRFLNLDFSIILRRLLIELDTYSQSIQHRPFGLFVDYSMHTQREDHDYVLSGLITSEKLQWLFSRAQYLKRYLQKQLEANQLQSVTHITLRDILLPQTTQHQYYQKTWADEKATPVERFEHVCLKQQKQTITALSPKSSSPASDSPSSSPHTSTHLFQMENSGKKWAAKQTHLQLITNFKKFIVIYQSLEKAMRLGNVSEAFSKSPLGKASSLSANKPNGASYADVLTHLDLRPHADFVSDNIFTQLITYLPNIKSVNTTGCTQLTSKMFSATHNYPIKHWVAIGFQDDASTFFKPYVYPELEILILDNSPWLQSLAISAPKLTILSLRYCPEITEKTIDGIKANSPHLKKLVISGNKEMKTFLGDWPELEELIIEDSAIEHIEINAPNLKYLGLRGNKHLRAVTTNSHVLADLGLDVADCKILTHENIATQQDIGHFLTQCDITIVSGPRVVGMAPPPLPPKPAKLSTPARHPATVETESPSNSSVTPPSPASPYSPIAGIAFSSSTSSSSSMPSIATSMSPSAASAPPELNKKLLEDLRGVSLFNPKDKSSKVGTVDIPRLG